MNMNLYNTPSISHCYHNNLYIKLNCIINLKNNNGNICLRYGSFFSHCILGSF